MKLKKNLAYRKIDGKIFIVDMKTSMLHSVNEIGSLIIDLLQKNYNFNEIAQKIVQEYDVNIEDVILDIKNFVSILREKKLIE